MNGAKHIISQIGQKQPGIIYIFGAQLLLIGQSIQDQVDQGRDLRRIHDMLAVSSAQVEHRQHDGH
jgi:hypothetical protein